MADRAGAAAGGHAAARDAGAVLRDGVGAGRAEGQRGLRQTQPRQDVQVGFQNTMQCSVRSVISDLRIKYKICPIK